MNPEILNFLSENLWKYPQLFDKKHQHYCNRMKRKAAYNTLGLIAPSRLTGKT